MMESTNRYDVTGYKKVHQEGGVFITATFFNPTTKEEKVLCVRDYDYADCSRDHDDLYKMEIDKEVRKIWLHHNGKILPGDTVKVVKGRTIQHGFVGTVREIRPYYDNYKRWIADYIYFVGGGKINSANCELVKE